MKTEHEIQSKLNSIRCDPRMHEAVTIEVNAPLALIQVQMEGQIQILNWVLKND